MGLKCAYSCLSNDFLLQFQASLHKIHYFVQFWDITSIKNMENQCLDNNISSKWDHIIFGLAVFLLYVIDNDLELISYIP